MVAALGNDVAMNCAAARAGIVRSQALIGVKNRSEVDGDEEPIIAHVAELRTRGFAGDVRLIRLAEGALTDLLAHTPQLDWAARRTSFYLSLPAADRTADQPSPDATEAARRDLERARQILLRAAALARWPASVELGGLGISGHTGGLEALQCALDDLNAGVIDNAVLLGADSLADVSVLAWLQEHERLKCDGAPDGLQPGEAGVAIALAREPLSESAPGRNPRILAVQLSEEPRSLVANLPARGETLSQVVARAWQAGACATTPWIVLDGNGEVFRAMDWGYALVRLRGISAAFSDPVVWYPAISFGDTGAASALAGICVTVRAWERGYAPGDSAIIAAASDGPARGTVTLRAS
jgi:3-oxoacyl-[acyl-carrier-protein] synthase-1